METYKILILSNDLDYIFTLRLETIEALLAAGFSVAISAPINDRASFFESIGCTFHPVEFTPRGKNPLSNLNVLKNYYSLAKRLNPDVVLTYTIKSNIYGGLVCRVLRKPQLANMTGLGNALMDQNLTQKLVLVLLRIAFKKTTKVFLQNEQNYQYFIDRKISTPEQSVLIAGSGVNLERHALEPYPEDDATVRLIFIGRIIKDKGIGELLEAMQFIHQKYPFCTCDLVGWIGEPVFEEPLKKYVESGAGEYLGFQNNIHPLIAHSHAVVLPSYHEGIANALLEGAAAGRPVLSTEHIGCRSTFDDGISGIMFQSRSTESLIEAIETFIALPYEQRVLMGLAGRKKMEREFDRTVIVNKYMDEIKRILHGLAH